MRASPAAARAPQPLPLPLPPPPLSLPSPPAAPRRGRHRTSSASSSCSSSSSSAASSFFSCPLPSPAASPPRGSAASLVPFSWERHPGVPKTSSSRGGLGSPTGGAPLPLPPPLLGPAPRRRRRRSSNASASAAASSSVSGSKSIDPFVAAFAECMREEDDVDSADHGADVAVAESKLWLSRRTKHPAPSSGRRWRIAGGGGGIVSFLDLYGCKSAMAVADGIFLARRPPVVAHGRRASRR